MDETTSSGSSSWETWIQGAGTQLLGGYIQNETRDPLALDKLRIQALGQYGIYNEGQAGIYRTGQMGGINPTMLLLMGGAIVAVMLLKD